VAFAALRAEFGCSFERVLLLFRRGRVAFRGDDAAACVAIGWWRNGCDVVGWRCWARVRVCLLFLFVAGLGWMHLFSRVFLVRSLVVFVLPVILVFPFCCLDQNQATVAGSTSMRMCLDRSNVTIRVGALVEIEVEVELSQLDRRHRWRFGCNH
jgi:hypothetical protein